MSEVRIEVASSRADVDACIAIRMEVFVDEQKVPRDEEIDAYDARATHLLARHATTNEPLGTARIVVIEGRAKIGRVCVVARARKLGVGRALMLAAIDEGARVGANEAYLDAQVSAKGFYESLGFVAGGDEFLDVGIPHVTMRRPLRA